MINLAIFVEDSKHCLKRVEKLNYISHIYKNFNIGTASKFEIMEDVIPETNIEGDDFLQVLSLSWNIFQNNNGPHLLGPRPNQEWIFYGGSFDPWHEGHKSCIELLKKYTGQDAYLLLDRNPHKPFKTHHSLYQHWNQIAEKIEDPIDKLYPGFLLSPRTNPTIQWVQKLRMDFSESKLSLLMGSDSFHNIFKWTEANKLLHELTSLYVVARQNSAEDISETTQKIIHENPKIQIKWLGHHPFENISSTQLRATKK